MNFKQRLKLYLFGFSIGCIILMVVLNKKGCTSYSELKLQELVSQSWKINDHMRCKLQCLGFANDSLFIKGLKNCKVNYDKSDVHAEPCGRYVVESLPNTTPSFTMLVSDCGTTSGILDVVTGSKACNCK